MMTAEDLICSWVDTSVDMVEKVAQKGISAGMREGDMAQCTLGEDKALGTLGEDKALGTLGEDKALGTLGEDKAQCTLGEDKALGTLGEDKALGTEGVGTQEEAGKAACTAAVGKTLC
jgi:hypothetical protein